MKKYRLVVIVSFIIGCLVLGCNFFSRVLTINGPSSSVPTETNLCPEIPSNFSKSDLFGNWVTRYSPNDKDELMISDDGTYRQRYDDPDSKRHYESGALSWTLEYRKNGYIWLHLKGMRWFGDIPSLSDRPGGGVDPNSFKLIDYCENQEMTMENEVILIVTGSKTETARNIILRKPRVSGSDWTYFFKFYDGH
jgi:hypothetical protein